VESSLQGEIKFADNHLSLKLPGVRLAFLATRSFLLKLMGNIRTKGGRRARKHLLYKLVIVYYAVMKLRISVVMPDE
jgi:hypothetical protein